MNGGLRQLWASVADHDRRLGWVMLGPAIVYIVAFIGVPFVLAVLLSFSNATVGNPTIHHFVGLHNFIEVIHQPQFLTGLENSLLVTFVTLAVLLVLATIEVELLARPFRFKRLVQTLLILPWAMPVALAAIAWLWLLDSQFSPLDWIFRQIHVLGPGGIFGPSMHFYYLGRTGLALASIIALNVWRMLPLAVIIVLAGRLSIPQELFDQAEIDGAGLFRTLFRITIPALTPVLIVAVLFTGLLVFGDMAIVNLLTSGGPGNSTQVLPYWAFLQGINGGDLGAGAAVALFLLPVLLAVAVFALHFAYRSRED
ncbi:MAG TPA: sugar ABC transporter permease [Gammaproteobacteria bacterium]|nr:sugar ABC transporter permease [Gammaproteobacteria bacterium]HYW93290.1 sugar ABC transporter permease [Gammaproteobacteria bacterium]